ncbi:MAG TPA: site-2 protease family protein [Verrucomicrobiae bacterium]|jgi:Zn-dependent protease|nr:site-2 protease family protein [Verrucomicrobiae bacterium]
MEWAVWITIFLVTVIFHEVCHGLAALALGDTTARDAGRLTLNPLKHVDLFWTVLFPALLFFSTHGRFAFGMAKPVPVNFNRLRYPRRGMIGVALAGPAANLVLAAVLRAVWKATGSEIALLAIYFNLGVAVFNLLPVPPLDGSRVAAGLLPVSAARVYMSLERAGIWIVFALYLSGVLVYWVIPGMDLFCHLLGLPRLRDVIAWST